MKGNRTSDEQVLQKLGAPTFDLLVRRNRLSYLASVLRAPAVHLRALIATRTPEGGYQPWTKCVRQDLCEVWRMSPFKLAELGHPLESPDRWHYFIAARPAAWKLLVKAWARQTAVQSQVGGETKRRRMQGPDKEGGDKANPFACDSCHCRFASERALQMHFRVAHGARCSAKWFADSNGMCPICFKIFPTRLRLVAHLTEKRHRGDRVPCGSRLGSARPLGAERVAQLDAVDTAARTKARKAGKTQPTVGGRRKRPARGVPQPPSKRLRSKTTVV